MTTFTFGSLRAAVLSAAIVGTAAIGATTAASAGQIYFNGFETDTAGWTGATRVASGNNGITSATGGFHAESTTISGTFTDWGGYNFGAGNAVPTAFQEYKTSIDIYLDLGGNWDNDTRFDFSSAINSSVTGTHLRDFIFNAGFYDSSDMTGPGAGTDRFVISASNNAQRGSAFAKNPDKDPIAISDSGWYTFMHRFYDNAGVLAVDMSILDSNDMLVNSWTLSDPGDLIPGVAGGNRYGWFDLNEFDFLAFDNAFLEVAAVPEPGTLALFGLGLAGLGFVRRRRVA